MKLTALGKSLDEARKRKKILTKDLQDEKALVTSTARTFNERKGAYKLWIDRLVVAAESISAQLSAMGLPEYHYSTAEGDTASTRLTIFFESLIEVLEKHRGA